MRRAGLCGQRAYDSDGATQRWIALLMRAEGHGPAVMETAGQHVQKGGGGAGGSCGTDAC